jgi:hypothetical protein
MSPSFACDPLYRDVPRLVQSLYDQICDGVWELTWLQDGAAQVVEDAVHDPAEELS